MAKANKKIALGMGLAAAAGAAGYYFFGSKHALQNRKKTMKWAEDMKTDVLKKAKTLKKLDERAYKTLVNEAMKAYINVKSIKQADVRAAAAELRENWEKISHELKRATKTGAKQAKKVTKKTARGKGHKQK